MQRARQSLAATELMDTVRTIPLDFELEKPQANVPASWSVGGWVAGALRDVRQVRRVRTVTQGTTQRGEYEQEITHALHLEILGDL